MEIIARRKAVRSDEGRLVGRPAPGFSSILGDKKLPLPSQVTSADQTNTAMFFDKSFFFKVYRRLEEGVHPELEIGRFLSDQVGFRNVAPMGGALEYRRNGEDPFALGILQGFVISQGDAWNFTLGEVKQYVDRVLMHREEARQTPEADSEPQPGSPPERLALGEMMGGFYPEMVALLGRRTGELHLALASRSDDHAFAPEPFALLYQRSVYQSMHSRAKKTLDLLRKNLLSIPEELRPEAEALLGLEQAINKVLQKFVVRKFSTFKTRIHGDYHLGQVLYTGNDFYIMDFEGEPVKPLSERRIKRSPLRDVAGMIRSFYYAAFAVLMQRSQVRDEDMPFLVPWLMAWYRYNAGVFVAAYRETVADAEFMPKDPEEVEIMLQSFMLDKALYELGYELNNRPQWVGIPLRAIRDLLLAERWWPAGEEDVQRGR